MGLKIDHDDTTNNVLHGCLIGWLCMIVAMLLAFFAISRIIPDAPDNVQRVIQLASWLFGIGVGGYIAARRAGAASYRTSLYVGLLALIFIVARLPQQADSDFIDGFWAVLTNPAEHWRHAIGLVLTVPASLLGGWIAQRRGGLVSDKKLS